MDKKIEDFFNTAINGLDVSILNSQRVIEHYREAGKNSAYIQSLADNEENRLSNDRELKSLLLNARSNINGWEHMRKFFYENRNHPVFEEVERKMIEDGHYSAPRIFVAIIEKLMDMLEE